MSFDRDLLRFVGLCLKSPLCKCGIFIACVVVMRLAFFSSNFDLGNGVLDSSLVSVVYQSSTLSHSEVYSKKSKFLEVPQIVWGLNNQKIAFARACLTARMLNRTLLMPSLSASLFYKEMDLLKPIPFDEIFQFEFFNSACKGFVQLGRYSEVSNITDVIELQKGSGRRWTVEKDLDQLKQFGSHPYDQYEMIKIVGKNPFLWHDHWPVKDYAKIFQCLALDTRISEEADKVVSRIKQIGLDESLKSASLYKNENLMVGQVPYIAVHMRIEKDWMIHCKKLHQRLNVSEICSSKEEIMQRLSNIPYLKTPIPVYLAVADDLLEDNSILSGWAKGLFPFEKKKLGVLDVYKRHPYLIQSAIDYEVCLRSSVFVGNSFSTFSSLVVLERTQRMTALGDKQMCGMDAKWPSYAYNLAGESQGARPWVTNMSDPSLEAISYGSNHIFCS